MTRLDEDGDGRDHADFCVLARTVLEAALKQMEGENAENK